MPKAKTMEQTELEDFVNEEESNDFAKDLNKFLTQNAKDSWSNGNVKSVMFLAVKFLEQNYNITKKDKDNGKD